MAAGRIDTWMTVALNPPYHSGVFERSLAHQASVNAQGWEHPRRVPLSIIIDFLDTKALKIADPVTMP